MSKHNFLGFDFGAESGRAILGILQDNKIELKEIHRFPNGMLTLHENYHWNIFRLFEEMKKALKICVSEGLNDIESMGLDTWGVDYALLAKDGSILGVPYAYRDPRTNTAIAELTSIMPKEKIYDLTGIQFMQFNTLFQLYAAQRDKCPLLDIATDLLFIPDIFDYLFTGVKKSEFTFATTSQLFNPIKGDWEPELFKTIGIPIGLMQKIVQPGTVFGQLTPKICSETGMHPIKVVAVASHDTGSAIVSVPAEDENFAYISSGTWSLMGMELKEPHISAKGLSYNFTNEGGVENTYRYLKNIMGLWLIQECRRIWSAKKEISYPELVQMAMQAKPFECLINPDDLSFYNPENMPEAIKDYCRKTGQTVPDSEAQITRCIFESLAMKYRLVFDQLKEVSGKPLNKIHIIGGGTKNQLLNQFTANAAGVPVIAGPSEATAIGNIMVQAMGLGYVKSLSEIRQVVRNSFELDTFRPEGSAEWQVQFEKFKKLP